MTTDTATIPLPFPKAPMVHALKCWPDDFDAIVRGEKTHEARFDDRGFAVGDTLRLREWTPDEPYSCDWLASEHGLTGTYTGRDHDVTVTHITRGQYGLPENLAVMSIRRAPIENAELKLAYVLSKLPSCDCGAPATKGVGTQYGETVFPSCDACVPERYVDIYHDFPWADAIRIAKAINAGLSAGFVAFIAELNASEKTLLDSLKSIAGDS